METLKEILARLSKADILNLTDSEALNLLVSLTSLTVATLSLIITLIVLFYAACQFISKRGSKFRGAFSISSSMWSPQRYVGEVLLENTKDKVVAISVIYLRINKNIYLELINYSDSPRIISPFETIKLNFNEGVSGYTSSCFKINLDPLLADNKIPKMLVVSTPQGLSKVKAYKTLWDVYFESLKNFFITPVHPVKKHHKGENFSDNLKFIVSSSMHGKQVAEYRLFRGNTYEIEGVPVSADSYSSAKELELYLHENNKSLKTLAVMSATYTDKEYDTYKNIEIDHYGFLGTYITGPLITKFYNLHLRLKRKRRSR